MILSALDFSEIQRTLAGLAQAVDFGRIDEYCSYFTEDAHFTTRGLPVEGAQAGGHVGRGAIRAMATSVFAGTLGNCRHWNGIPVISESSTGANVVSYFQVLRIGVAPYSGVIMTGLYEDAFARTDTGWLISSRTCSIDPQPAAGVSTDPLVVRRDEFVEQALSR